MPPPAEGACRTLSAAGGPRRQVPVRRHGVVAGRRVGVQGQGLLQAAGAGAVAAGEGQEPGQAAVPTAAGGLFSVQAGRQAVGIPRPAAGEAGVEPGALRPAVEGGRMDVSQLGGAVARTRLGESQPLSAAQRLARGGVALWEGPRCIRG